MSSTSPKVANFGSVAGSAPLSISAPPVFIPNALLSALGDLMLADPQLGGVARLSAAADAFLHACSAYGDVVDVNDDPFAVAAFGGVTVSSVAVTIDLALLSLILSLCAMPGAPAALRLAANRFVSVALESAAIPHSMVRVNREAGAPRDPRAFLVAERVPTKRALFRDDSLPLPREASGAPLQFGPSSYNSPACSDGEHEWNSANRVPGAPPRKRERVTFCVHPPPVGRGLLSAACACRSADV